MCVYRNDRKCPCIGTYVLSFPRTCIIVTYKVKLATLDEGDTSAPFSIVTTPGQGATLFPGLLNFTIDPYLKMLSVKQGGLKYHF